MHHHHHHQRANSVPPTLRIPVSAKSEFPSESQSSHDAYSSTTVESPSSTLSTTEEEESYLSEPSPKRFKSDSEDATYDDSAVHSYSADAPPAHAWHSLWDAQFNDFLVTE
jgi:hypothetical protein